MYSCFIQRRTELSQQQLVSSMWCWLSQLGLQQPFPFPRHHSAPGASLSLFYRQRGHSSAGIQQCVSCRACLLDYIESHTQPTLTIQCNNFVGETARLLGRHEKGQGQSCDSRMLPKRTRVLRQADMLIVSLRKQCVYERNGSKPYTGALILSCEYSHHVTISVLPEPTSGLHMAATHSTYAHILDAHILL